MGPLIYTAWVRCSASSTWDLWWYFSLMKWKCKMKKKTHIIAKLSFSLYIEHKYVTLWSWAKCDNSIENALLNSCQRHFCISWTHTVDFPSLALFSCSSLPLLFQPRQSGLQTFRPFGTESGELKLQIIYFDGQDARERERETLPPGHFSCPSPVQQG